MKFIVKAGIAAAYGALIGAVGMVQSGSAQQQPPAATATPQVAPTQSGPVTGEEMMKMGQHMQEMGRQMMDMGRQHPGPATDQQMPKMGQQMMDTGQNMSKMGGQMMHH
jgi:hypothetical protein